MLERQKLPAAVRFQISSSLLSLKMRIIVAWPGDDPIDVLEELSLKVSPSSSASRLRPSTTSPSMTPRTSS